MKSITVKIPLADLISFRDNSSHIKSNNVMPILGYVKFDSGMIIKNNLKDFVIQESNFTGTFLVEERTLFNYIKFAKSSDILFTITENKITISNGSRPATCPTENPENFPMPDTSGSTKIEISKDVLIAIENAANYASTASEDEYHQIKPNIFVGNKSVGASDGLIAYYQKFESDLPEMILSKQNADKIGALSKRGSVAHSSNDRFNLFYSGNVTYGFIKLDAKYFDLGSFFKYESENNFIVNKSDFLSFNDTCVSVSPSKTIYPVFSVKDNTLSLSMTDKDYELDVQEQLTCNGTMDDSFKYIASLMSKLLKTAPDDELTFHQSNGKFYITGESGFNSLIMKIVDL